MFPLQSLQNASGSSVGASRRRIAVNGRSARRLPGYRFKSVIVVLALSLASSRGEVDIDLSSGSRWIRPSRPETRRKIVCDRSTT